MKDKIFVIGALFIYPISFVMWVLGHLLRVVRGVLAWLFFCGIVWGTLEYCIDFINDLSRFIRDLSWWLIYHYTP